jgi:protein-tyrosine phosphatase
VRILFVCTGNVCRSAIAERLATTCAREKLAHSPEADMVETGSPGLSAVAGRAIDPHSAAALVELGGNPAGFRSREFTRELAEDADLVLTMTCDQRRTVLGSTPRGLRRTFTLTEVADLLQRADLTGLAFLPLTQRGRELGRRLDTARADGSDVKAAFIPVTAQADNVGDVWIRRLALDSLRNCTRLHIFVGNSSDEHTRAPHLEGCDRIYRSPTKWMLALASTRCPRLAFAPGEYPAGLHALPLTASYAMPARVTRLRGGRVARVGQAATGHSRLTRLLDQCMSRLSIFRWLRTFEDGSPLDVHPDIAFSQVSDGTQSDPRRFYAVALRGDRPMPTDSWGRSVVAFARSRGLTLAVASQRRLEDERRLEIAWASYAAEVVPFDGHDLVAQEDRLRHLCSRSAVVHSDRLHALFLGANCGALPSALAVDVSGKVPRHFSIVGLEVVTSPPRRASEPIHG